MTNITKISRLSTYRNTGTHKLSQIRKPDQIGQIESKSEAHNAPDKSNNNDQIILDIFYKQTHHLLSTYVRLSHSSEENEQKKYFKNHKTEVISGAKSMIKAMNRLLHQASQFDFNYGTHYHFLIETIIHDYHDALSFIGIYYYHNAMHLNKRKFYLVLCDQPEKFDCLFNPQYGIIDRLSKIHLQLISRESSTDYGGSIIDLRG